MTRFRGEGHGDGVGSRLGSPKKKMGQHRLEMAIEVGDEWVCSSG